MVRVPLSKASFYRLMLKKYLRTFPSGMVFVLIVLIISTLNTTFRYIYFLTAMKKTEESLRRLKKGKKSAFSLFGSSTSTKEDDGRADEEKIRTQMILDVNAFGKDAESLGVSVNDNSTYHALRDLAHAPLTDTT